MKSRNIPTSALCLTYIFKRYLTQIIVYSSGLLLIGMGGISLYNPFFPELFNFPASICLMGIGGIILCLNWAVTHLADLEDLMQDMTKTIEDQKRATSSFRTQVISLERQNGALSLTNTALDAQVDQLGIERGRLETATRALLSEHASSQEQLQDIMRSMSLQIEDGKAEHIAISRLLTANLGLEHRLEAQAERLQSITDELEEKHQELHYSIEIIGRIALYTQNMYLFSEMLQIFKEHIDTLRMTQRGIISDEGTRALTSALTHLLEPYLPSTFETLSAPTTFPQIADLR